MSLKIEQTCAKCGRTRKLEDRRGVMRMDDELDDRRKNGGWRIINDRDICNTCISEFLADAVN